MWAEKKAYHSDKPEGKIMLDLITKGIAKIFGTKSERDIKELMPYVEHTNIEFAKLLNISDEDLRGKSQELKVEIKERLSKIDEELSDLHKKIQDDVNLSIDQKEAVFAKIDKLEKDRDKELEKVLLDILPRAFAIVKETARRWKDIGKMEVAVGDHDRKVAARRKGVEIVGDKAIWHNSWTAAGADITWNMMHYDVQLIGGVVLHQGKIAEMATGEGKTLVATLPAFLNALAGLGVHIVTVNDYLAKRDSEWMAPLFEFHLLNVDCIDKHEPNSEERRNAYLADITYGTNNEFGFDYLRDNMARGIDDLVQRKHHFAMVDEVDSVLVDDARTPLIISGPVPRGDKHMFHDLKPRVVKLVEEQKKLVNNFLVEAKKKIGEDDKEEGGLALFRAHRGLPKAKPLIKFLSEQGNRAILQKVENHHLQDNQKEMPKADEPLFFTIDEKNNSIELTDKGADLITGEGEDPSLFVLPDIGSEMALIENDKTLSKEEKLSRTEKLVDDYNLKSERLHTINQLLKAYTLFEKETEYIIVEGKVKIVDEQTGRVMEGRRYSDGLHQALEAKESVKVEDATQTYATVTLQNYFRMYHKLCGMTGTAETEAGEFMEIYKLDVVTIPTNRSISRKDHEDKVYKTIREKFNAVAEEIIELNKIGRPVLVGTTSVEISEVLSRMLKMRGIKHQVLNAKYHQKEAEIVAAAGQSGAVTIATNMAGRGTDIKLSPEAKAAGGLAIVGTERHESRRVDRQLRGRSGRQGDPGSSQFFVSLEDSLMRLFGSERIIKIMDTMGLEEGEVIQHSMITRSIERAQTKVEENNFGVRKRLLEYDDVMNSQREVIYRRRRNALYGERLPLDVLNMLYYTCDSIASGAAFNKDLEDFRLEVVSKLGYYSNLTEADLGRKPEVLSDLLYNEALKQYQQRKNQLAENSMPIFKDIERNRDNVENVIVPFTDGRHFIQATVNLKKALESNGQELGNGLEKYTTLSFIDQEWKEHLRAMDDLKQSVQNAVYEQKDPLLIYKMEAFNLFKNFIGKVDGDITNFLMRSEIPVQRAEDVSAASAQRPREVYNEEKDEVHSILGNGSSSQQQEEDDRPKLTPLQSDRIAGRNDRVTVQYMDGTIKRDVKFKTVEEDLRTNRCILLSIDAEA